MNIKQVKEKCTELFNDTAGQLTFNTEDMAEDRETLIDELEDHKLQFAFVVNKLEEYIEFLKKE